LRVGRKSVSAVVLVLALLFSQVVLSRDIMVTNAEVQPEVVDLIISLNIPEAEANVTGDTLQLQALHLYKDGHFEKASKQLEWQTSNKNVAAVDGQGLVRLANHNGRTFISSKNIRSAV
jgi:beta-N-acetylhexosaminidase